MTTLSKAIWCLIIANSLGASTASAMWGRSKAKDKADACTAMLAASADGTARFELVETKNPLVEGVRNAAVRFLRDGRASGSPAQELELNEKRAQTLGLKLADLLLQIEQRGDVQTIFDASMAIDDFGILPEGELEEVADLIATQLANLSHKSGLPGDLVSALTALGQAKEIVDGRGAPERPGAALPVDLEKYREVRLHVASHLKWIQQSIQESLHRINEARTRLMAYERYEHICATTVRTLSDVIDRRMRNVSETELEKERLNNNYLTFLTTRDRQILRMRKAIAKFDAKLARLTEANLELLSMANLTSESLGFLLDRSTEGSGSNAHAFQDEWNRVTNEAARALADLN